MKQILTISILLCSLLFSESLFAQTSVDLLIKNIQVIDVRRGRIIKHQDVWVQGDRIVRIKKSSDQHIQATMVVDGSGKFLLPGLWDMHTHNWWQQHFSDHYVHNGVLGVRNMYTPMTFIKPLKDSIEKKLLAGPKYYAAGRVLEGPKPAYPDWIVVDSLHKIKSALDSLQSEGSDFVKVYNKIPREVYFELMKEAKRRGMSVQGHVPMAVSALEASQAGQKSLEHLLGIPDLCTHDTLFENKHAYNWYEAVMREDDYGTLVINDRMARKAFSVFRKNSTYVCPTLTVWDNLLHPDRPYENEALLSYFPKEMTGFWFGMIQGFRGQNSDYKQMAGKKYDNLKKATYLLYKSGVPLLTGTDAMNPYCYPGYSLHRELELLQECGIPNAAILKMATLNAASFFNLSDYGQIKEGYHASMLILDGDPLSLIQNTRKIHAVILNGKVVNRTAHQP